ncbi:MAG: RNA methyltransferase [Ignavibacteriales bacterium]|nr:RNA methyltransferase [Ignavibacteriales bacterium]
MRLSKSETRYLRSLARKKFRESEKKFLVEGWRAVKDALSSPFKIELATVLTKYLENPDYQPLLQQLQDRGVALKEISETELRQISDTVHSQGIVALVHQKKYRLPDIVDDKWSFVVVTDAISDPGNLGSILRSADWFGVDAVLLGTGSVELYNEKVVRATASSIFHLPAVENVDLLKALPIIKNKGFFVAATAAGAKTDYQSLQRKTKMAIVLGSEARGIQKVVHELADAIVSIPRVGRAESLNVGVACGIMLAHFRNTKNS